MRPLALFCAACCLAYAAGQKPQQQQGRIDVILEPAPYTFSYRVDGDEGRHEHEESSDGSGHVRGSYIIELLDGTSRTVQYVADEAGYRAEITTNELGTESKNSADVKWTSSALTGAEAALKFGPAAPADQRPASANAGLYRAVGSSGLTQPPAPIVVQLKPQPVVAVSAPSARPLAGRALAAPARSATASAAAGARSATPVARAAATNGGARSGAGAGQRPGSRSLTPADGQGVPQRRYDAGASFIQVKIGDKQAQDVRLNPKSF